MIWTATEKIWKMIKIIQHKSSEQLRNSGNN